MSEQTVYDKLAERFAAEDHKTLAARGGQTYVPWNLVAERLNKVLGVTGWSFSVIREGFTANEGWVLGRLTAVIDGETTFRDQYGCADIALGQSLNTDLLKKAGTDALKKCAQVLGVALYLTDAEDRAEVQAEMLAAKKAANAPKPADKSGPKPVAPTNINAARNAAAAGGAVTHHRCTECATDVPKDGTVTILKKKEGPTVAVSVKDFEPVCKERLGSFHCARCYDRKYWGVA